RALPPLVAVMLKLPICPPVPMLRISKPFQLPGCELKHCRETGQGVKAGNSGLPVFPGCRRPKYKVGHANWFSLMNCLGYGLSERLTQEDRCGQFARSVHRRPWIHLQNLGCQGTQPTSSCA